MLGIDPHRLLGDSNLLWSLIVIFATILGSAIGFFSSSLGLVFPSRLAASHQRQIEALETELASKNEDLANANNAIEDLTSELNDRENQDIGGCNLNPVCDTDPVTLEFIEVEQSKIEIIFGHDVFIESVKFPGNDYFSIWFKRDGLVFLKDVNLDSESPSYLFKYSNRPYELRIDVTGEGTASRLRMRVFRGHQDRACFE